MKCTSCNAANPKGAKFCQDCGKKLQLSCSNCSNPYTEGANFCINCGIDLRVQVSESSEKIIAERRQITVLFCDLVGSTALSERLDPEDLRYIIQRYQTASEKIIARFGGYIAQYLGDGILVYFGYPKANEDDARRAIQTGLSIIESIKGLNKEISHTELSVRVALHTGLVVVGEVGSGARKEQLAIGMVPNVAARLQGLAQPNTLVISQVTYLNCKGFFNCKSIGEHSLKGLSNKVEVFEVLNERNTNEILTAAANETLTPLIGRANEMQHLLDCWEKAKAYKGSFRLVSGEAGIGKSRLIQALKQKIAADPTAWLVEVRCFKYHQNSPFYPTIEFLKNTVLKYEKGDSEQRKLNKLEGFLLQYPWKLPEILPLYASLLSIPLLGMYPELDMPPVEQKQKTMEALIQTLKLRAQKQSVVLFVEDLHWVDASSLEWLSLFMNHIKDERILIIGSARPEFKAPWKVNGFYKEIKLLRLSSKDIIQICQYKSQGKELPADLLQHIVEKTDGVPLFVEELTQNILESDVLIEESASFKMRQKLSAVTIPSTLQDSLMARLDRLGMNKEIAQVGAVIGRTFSFDLLKTVLNFDENILKKHLKILVESGLVSTKGVAPNSIYSFGHALVQDTAYQSILKNKRTELHRQVGNVLQDQFPQTVATAPELIAHHFTEGLAYDLALPLWIKAGQQSIKKNAIKEATNQLESGLQLLGSLPEGEEKDHLELNLKMVLAASLFHSKGLSDPSLEKINLRTFELCKKLGDSSKLIFILDALSTSYNSRGMYAIGQKYAEQADQIALEQNDTSLLLVSSVQLGITHHYLANYNLAQSYFDKAYQIYNPDFHSAIDSLGRGDYKHQILSLSGPNLCLLGYPDRAIEMTKKSRNLALNQPRAIDKYIAHANAMAVFRFLKKFDQAEKDAQAILDIALQSKDMLWVSIGQTSLNTVKALKGDLTACKELEKAVIFQQQIGFLIGLPYVLYLLARSYYNLGKYQQSDRILKNAFLLMDQTGEGWGKPEMYRFKGLLLELSGEDPMAAFQKGLAVAKHQHAKLYELRLAMELAKRWKAQGQKEKALSTLLSTYDWFTEGFDNVDLLEAAKLIAILEG